jgi:cyclopropane-fatty-acyl-phospholipid synthase
MTIADLITGVLGPDLPVGFRAFDGSRAGPEDAPATVVLRSPDAIRRIVTAPGELGFGRAYVAGDIEIEGDIFALLELRHQLPALRLNRDQWLQAPPRWAAGLRPLPPPPEEASACAVAAIRRPVMPRRSPTTTCRTTSTGSCSAFDDVPCG